MNAEQAVAAVIDALEASQIPYMVVGSYAVNLYAIPRSSQDADIVVDLAGRSIQDLLGRLPPGFRYDPQIRFEGVTGTSRIELHVDEASFRFELFDLSDDPHDRERFNRRRRYTFRDFSAWVPTAEDVVIMKVRWCSAGRRSKDYDDVRNVLAVQADALDWEYIHRWCREHSTLELLDEIRRSIVVE